jgi:nicotinamidase-related amidase
MTQHNGTTLAAQSGPVDHRYTFLDPDNAAMLFIDHQVGTLLFGIHDIDTVNLLNNTLKLAEGAKAFGLPTILSTSNPTAINGPLFQELVDTLPDAPIIDRTLINAWDDENFVRAVEATGRKQLIIAGVTSNVCLAFPAIAAAGAGYDVYAVLDASGAVSDHSLLASIARMTQAGIKMADSGMVLAEMLRDWASRYGPGMGQVFGKREANAGLLFQHMYAEHALAQH